MRILSFLFFLIILNSCSKQQPAQSQVSGSVDSKVCATCHSAQAKTYQATGMGRSFSNAKLEQMPSNLDKPATFFGLVGLGTELRGIVTRSDLQSGIAFATRGR